MPSSQFGTDLLNQDVGTYYEHAYRRGAIQRFARAFFKAGDVSGLAGAINVTFGALVYDQVNRETNAHAIIKKEDWERSGFRVTTSNPNTKLFGGADPGLVGANFPFGTAPSGVGTMVDVSPTELKTIPAFVHTPFDLTLDAGFRARHDDGLDVWEWKLAVMRDIHAQGLSEETLRSAEAAQGVSTAATTDAKNDITNTSNDAEGRGLENLDRLFASEDERDDLAGNANAGWYDVYEGDVDRDTATTFDSVVVRGDGSKTTFNLNVPFSIDGLNTLLDDTETNGADEDSQVFLTRRDTRRAFYNELGSAGRFDLTELQAKLDMAGLSTSATHEGRDVTFAVRAYQGRPFVVDRNVPSNGTVVTSFPHGGTGKGRVFLLDQRYIHYKVGFPTLFVDVDNPVIRGQFDTRALYLTAEQLYVTRFNVHGKMRSIS